MKVVISYEVNYEVTVTVEAETVHEALAAVRQIRAFAREISEEED